MDFPQEIVYIECILFTESDLEELIKAIATDRYYVSNLIICAYSELIELFSIYSF